MTDMHNTPAARPDRTNIIIIAAALLLTGGMISAAIIASKGGSGTVVKTTEQQKAVPVEERIVSLARQVKVDPAKVAACVSEGRYTERVQNDEDNAFTTGGQGTPWSIVVDASGEVLAPIGGALPYASMSSTLDALLADPTPVSDLLAGYPNISAVRPIDSTDHITGASEPVLYIIEYSDFDCPYCQQFDATMQQVMQNYGEQVAWVYRHFPLDSLHPNARQVAEASECVAELGGEEAFWEFANRYYQQLW